MKKSIESIRKSVETVTSIVFALICMLLSCITSNEVMALCCIIAHMIWLGYQLLGQRALIRMVWERTGQDHKRDPRENRVHFKSVLLPALHELIAWHENSIYPPKTPKEQFFAISSWMESADFITGQLLQRAEPGKPSYQYDRTQVLEKVSTYHTDRLYQGEVSFAVAQLIHIYLAVITDDFLVNALVGFDEYECKKIKKHYDEVVDRLKQLPGVTTVLTSLEGVIDSNEART